MHSPDQGPAVTSAEYAARVNAVWGRRERAIRSWWQSPAVLAEVNRRVTGDPTLRPQAYFAREYGSRPFAKAVSLGSGGGQLERELVVKGTCQELLGLDLSEDRVAGAQASVGADYAERLRFETANLETWTPVGKLDLVVARDVLHHIEGLERLFEVVSDALQPDGLFYVDEFVGPSRFQWTDKQLEIIGRLLDRLSPELRLDLVTADGSLREPPGRPNLEAFIADDPSEAIRSDELPALLDHYFEPLEKRPYGGAIYQQLFNRIMGNFEGRDDLVRTLMEVDFLLTDEGVVQTDYLWAVYRPRRR